jgi:hypothetical protein
MTTMGHSLTGLSIGVLCVPGGRRWWWVVLFLNAFIGLANIPDWPFHGWGHDSYEVSHSLFVNLGLVAALVLAIGLWRWGRAAVGGWCVLACGALAWLSHLFLDTLYNHGQGLPMFWPASDAALALPIPWFSTLRETWTPDEHTGRVLLIEAGFYGALLLACVAVRLLLWHRARARRI